MGGGKKKKKITKVERKQIQLPPEEEDKHTVLQTNGQIRGLVDDSELIKQ